MQTAPIQIDSDIPMPPRSSPGAGRKALYPWKELAVGQSFVFPRKRVSFEAYRNHAQGCASAAGKVMGLKFRTRAVMEEGKHVIRVWRVA